MKLNSNLLYSCPEIVNNYLNARCDSVNQNLLIPGIKHSYAATGFIFSTFAGLFSRQLGERISNTWYDPISHTAVRRLCKPIEKMALLNACRKPSNRSALSFLDQSLIGLSQQVFNYIKEVNHLLTLPQTLRNHFINPSLDQLVAKPGVFLGKHWIWISGPIILAKRAIFITINKIFQIADCVMSTLTFKPNFKLFGYLKEIAKIGSEKAHLAVVDIALAVIEKKESQVRQQVIQGFGNWALDYFTTKTSQIGLKSALGLFVYSCLRPRIQNITQLSGSAVDAFGVALLTYTLWKNVFAPTLEPYHAAYTEEFDPASSNLKALCTTHSIDYLYPLLQLFQVSLSDPKILQKIDF